MDTAPTVSQAPPPAQPDLKAVKARQQAMWSSGDYAVVGTTLQIVGEELCEALDLRAGQKVLDVAAGNGNVSLAAARRWCEVLSTDYVPTLLERARERAAAERLEIEFREADAEALPFPDESFDVVVSTFGVMFTPDQERAAAELRACAARAARSASPTGRRRASLARSSKPSASTCPRPRVSARRRSGARASASRNCLVRMRPRSTRTPATSCSATARRSTGWQPSGPIMARCSRRSPRSSRRRRRP